jgi:hypothetical protein
MFEGIVKLKLPEPAETAFVIDFKVATGLSMALLAEILNETVPHAPLYVKFFISIVSVAFISADPLMPYFDDLVKTAILPTLFCSSEVKFDLVCEPTLPNPEEDR